MPQNWKTFKLGDLTSVITKGTTPSTYGFDFETSGINYIRAQSLNYDGTINEQAFSFISNKAHDKLKRSQLQANDILFSMAGAYLGMVGMVKESFCPANTNQAVGIIRVNNPSVYPKFVEYALRNPSTVAYVNSQSGQSAQPNINLAEIGNLSFSFPPLQEQIAIASILSALDDKIELNLQMNKTLEEMAMSLYKHWFVDFGPFQKGEFVDSELGMIPKGWEVKRLEDVAEVGSSKRIFLKEYVECGIPFYRGKEIIQLSKGGNISTELFISKERFKTIKDKFGVPLKNDILISSVGTIGVSWLVENNDPFYFKDGNLTWIKNYKESVTGNLIYQWLKSKETQEQIKSETIGSTQQALTISALRTLKIALPPEDSSIVNDVSNKFVLWNELFVSNKQEIQTLTTLRDTLLPKLISGEVRLKDVEKILTAAL